MTDARPHPRTRSTLSVDVPDDWYTKESITLLAPDGQANVIVSSEPLEDHLDTGDYAAIQRELLYAEFPEFTPISPLQEFTVQSGQLGLLWEFAWRPPDGVRVFQHQFYFARGGQGWTATATVPESVADERRALLISTLASIAIDDRA